MHQEHYERVAELGSSSRSLFWVTNACRARKLPVAPVLLIRQVIAQQRSSRRCAWSDNPRAGQRWVAEAPEALPNNNQAICPNDANSASNAATQICGPGRASNSGWVGNENVLGMAANLKS
jgi:hypothetical protein